MFSVDGISTILGKIRYVIRIVSYNYDVSHLNSHSSNPEISFVIPCLNEVESLPAVIQEIIKSNIAQKYSFEILIADNGSSDGSQEIAMKNGARVISIESRGYGAALIGGIRAAEGKWIVMGDADGSYSFSEAEQMVPLLESGHDLVMGNRFKGGIAPGAMPFLHRYLGNPVLSLLGRKLYKIEIGDFHCGLRAFSKTKILSIGLKSTGMEFASEMLVKASKSDLKVAEVPVTLKVDLRSRPPHLRTWRDGWRHLRFLFAYSPKWVFLTPTVFAFVAAIVTLALGIFGKIRSNGIEISYKTSIIFSAFAISASIFASSLGIARLILKPKLKYFRFHTELYSFLGLSMILIGTAGTLLQFVHWKSEGFGLQPVDLSLIHTVVYSGLICIGSICVIHGFLIGLLRSQLNE